MRADDRITQQRIRHMRDEANLLLSPGHRGVAITAWSTGALAVGAVAIGALAIGALAIGKLAIGRARIRRLEIDELIVGELHVTDALHVPSKPGPEQ
jgi:hypothetical protein